VKIYEIAVDSLMKKEGGHETKLVEKLVWVPVISFCKISFAVTQLMPY
jgi:hypothetical protein